ncbi:hypothetical protein llap_17840 [Limosa lapponica baueri]|uniref:Uncharacterized protein n=1 Tax=Limosa lapponica baueri TaxID=1758121 RepID=A0A2I0TDI0_LIMLA|nr:hypothetical protein llap_17840 [Limosa lapponica baueri]
MNDEPKLEQRWDYKIKPVWASQAAPFFANERNGAPKININKLFLLPLSFSFSSPFLPSFSFFFFLLLTLALSLFLFCLLSHFRSRILSLSSDGLYKAIHSYSF